MRLKRVLAETRFLVLENFPTIGNNDKLHRTNGWLRVALVIFANRGDAVPSLGSERVNDVVVGENVDGSMIGEMVTADPDLLKRLL